MNKILGILTGAGLVLGLTMSPAVYAADADHLSGRDSAVKEEMKGSSSHDKAKSEIEEVEKEHSLIAEKEGHDSLHEDHESSTAEAHESQTAEMHDSGATADRHSGSK